MDKEQFQLRNKIADLMDYLFPQVDKFPRVEKFAACTQIKNCVYRMAQQAIRVQRRPPAEKPAEVRELDLEIEFLRELLRHAHERQWLKHRAHKTSFSKISEIGKMTGALMRRYP